MTIEEKILSARQVMFDKGAPDDERIVEASWLMEAIKKNIAVHVEHAVIVGTFRLKHALITSQIKICSCTFRETMHFDYCRFEYALDLRSCIFEQDLCVEFTSFLNVNIDSIKILGKSFNCTGIRCSGFFHANHVIFEVETKWHFLNAVFNGPCRITNSSLGVVLIQGCTFEKMTFFDKTTFHGNLAIHETDCNALLSLDESTFNKSLDIKSSTFKRRLRLRKVTCHWPVFCFATKISGDLVATGASFGKAVKFENVQFGDKIDFCECHWGDEVSFNGCYVGHGAFFRKSKFHGEASFVNMRFANNAEFQEATFSSEKVISFNRSTFAVDWRFNNVTCNGPLDVLSASVYGTADFVSVAFDNSANFESTRFGSASFQNAIFKQEVSFKGCVFEHQGNFECTTFHEHANFSIATFDGWCNFLDATFLKSTEFIHAKFLQDARLDATAFSGEANFFEASFRHAMFSPDGKTEKGVMQFQGAVNLNGCTYDSITVHWRSLLVQLRNVHYNRETYVRLEETHRRQGDEKAADSIYFIRKRIESKEIRFTKQPLNWLGDRALWVLTGYGVRLSNLLYYMIAIVLLGTIAFSKEGAVVYDPKLELTPVQQHDPPDLTISESFWFTLKNFLPVDIHVAAKYVASEDCLEVGKYSIGIQYVVLAALLQMIGWILIPIGIAGLTGVLKK